MLLAIQHVRRIIHVPVIRQNDPAGHPRSAIGIQVIPFTSNVLFAVQHCTVRTIVDPLIRTDFEIYPTRCARTCTRIQVIPFTANLPLSVQHMPIGKIVIHPLAAARRKPLPTGSLFAGCSIDVVPLSVLFHLNILRYRGLIPERVQVHVAADTVDLAAARVLPAAVVGGERGVLHGGAILGDPTGLAVDVGAVERAVQVARVRVDAQIVVTGRLQFAVPGVDDAVVHARTRRAPMPRVRPVLQIVEHRVAQVPRVHARLAQQVHHVRALGRTVGRTFRIREDVHAEWDAETLAFADVALRLRVETIAPAVAQTDDRALDARVLHRLPVNRVLPHGHVDHALRLLGEQVVARVEERLRTVVRAPVRTVLVVLQRGELHRRVGRARLRGDRVHVTAVRSDLLLHIRGTHRNERLAIRLRQRIGLLALRAHDLRIGDRLARLDVLQLAFRRSRILLGHHRRVIGDLGGHLVRQLGIRIVRHRVGSRLIGDHHTVRDRTRRGSRGPDAGRVRVGVHIRECAGRSDAHRAQHRHRRDGRHRRSHAAHRAGCRCTHTQRTQHARRTRRIRAVEPLLFHHA